MKETLLDEFKSGKKMYGVSFKKIQELVERATPMKLNGCKNDWACANCDSDYGIIEGRDYCATCGQALDWDE